MHMYRALFLCVSVFHATRAHVRQKRADNQSTEPPVIITASGSFRGSWMISRRGRPFQAFRNIPYAVPPLGMLRFQPAEPILQYPDEVDATEEGPSCPQPVTPESPGYMDEDCLKLNVYTPSENGSNLSPNLLPVILYLPYGGFYASSGRSDVAGPRYLLDRDVVLVSCNYRLGSFGFLSTGDFLAPGNNGFKDQVVVLRWVQRHIAAFGGDPGRVALLGGGAGAYSVALHMLSPMSKGLFHRAISISGSPFSQVQIGHDQYDLAAKQARLVGCPSNNSSAIINCLRTKPWKEIADSVTGFIDFPTNHVLYWTVVVERDFGQERFMPYDPLNAVRFGRLYSVPYIVGQTRDEYSWLANIVLNNATLTKMLDKEYPKYAPLAFMLPRGSTLQAHLLRLKYLGLMPLRNDSTTLQKLGMLFGEALVGFLAHRLANVMCRYSKAPVYYYQFDYIGNHSCYEDPLTKKPVGVSHRDDLIYLFSMPGLFPDIGLTGTDAEMVDKMTAIVSNFALTGDPNPLGPQPELFRLSWPRMLPANRSYLRISSSFSVNQNLNEDRFRLWDVLYPVCSPPREIIVQPAPVIVKLPTVNLRF